MRATITISLKNLKNNLDYIKTKTNKNIIAVVKTNAYGHGIVEVSNALSQLNVNYLAVATLEEAILLRKHFIASSIMLFEKSSDYQLLHAYKITPSIVSIAHLKELIKTNIALPIQLKIETGLNRLGILEDEIDEAIELIKKSRLILKGIYTHYSSKEYSSIQDECFKRVIIKFNQFKSLMIHSQSTSTMFIKKEFTTHIRIGLGLYGLIDDENLKPLLSLTSPIYRIKRINKNDVVGYHDKKVNNDGYIITIPLGYADGIDSRRKNLATTNQMYLPQVGDTCMDLMMFYSKNPINQNSIIELIGDNLKAIDLAKLYSISVYELVTNLSLRLKRIYKK